MPPNENEESTTQKPPGEESANQNADAGGTGAPGEGTSADDTSPKSLEEAMALVSSLRKENAKHRTKNKSLEETVGKNVSELKKVKEALGLTDEDTEDPKTKVADLQKTNESLQAELSIAELAIEHGIPAEKKKYFKFLLAEKFEALQEGEEINDEDIASIVKEVKGTSGTKPSSTGQGGKPPAEGDKGAVTVEQFVNLGYAEKVALNEKNPALYDSLMKTAAQKRLLK